MDRYKRKQVKKITFLVAVEKAASSETDASVVLEEPSASESWRRPKRAGKRNFTGRADSIEMQSGQSWGELMRVESK